MREFPAPLEELWQLAGGDPRDPASDWNTTFEPIGLILAAPPKNEGLEPTPANAVTFAGTGGDGVHFSWLEIADKSDENPIVMTVPWAADSPNLVVGSSLHEFLSLGSRYGYFTLDYLAEWDESTLEELSAGQVNKEHDDKQRQLLSELSQHLSLSPWPEPKHRLMELQDQFASLMALPK